MPLPSPDSSLVAVPLPSEEDLKRVIGISYDSAKTLNVMKMFAGTDDMYPAVIGFIKAVFEAQGVNPKLREMIVLRVATKYHVLYEWAGSVSACEERRVIASRDSSGGERRRDRGNQCRLSTRLEGDR